MPHKRREAWYNAHVFILQTGDVFMPFHTGVFGNGAVYLTPPADVPDGTRAYVYLLAADEDRIAFYRRLVMIEPDDARLYNQLALAQIEADKLVDAEASLRRAVSLDFGFAEAHFNLGQLYVRQEQMDSAIHAFRKAADLAQDNAGFFRHLILTLLYLERDEEALAVLLEGIQTAPRLRNWASNEPLLTPFHDDPRWAEVVAAPDTESA